MFTELLKVLLLASFALPLALGARALLRRRQ